MIDLSDAALGGRCFVFRGAEMLVRTDGSGAVLPDGAVLAVLRPHLLRIHEIGTAGGTRCFAFEVAPDAPVPDGLQPFGLRALFPRLPPELYRLAGRAAQILEWDRAHRFCGRCGTETELGSGEHVRRCPACGQLHFPRLSPAVIVRISRGDELLLARSPHFAPGMYSVLAGFVEPGESLEEAVVREVREEVGVEIASLRYFGSQPWPFPHSLMVGFTAEHAGGDIAPDPAEVEDAGWYHVDALPLVPARLSIARALIDDYVRALGRDPDALRSPS